MSKFTRRFFLGTGAATAAVAASQLVKTKPGLAQTEQINLYSSRHYNTDDQLYDIFTNQTGIQVNLIEGKADELIERIKSEGANSPADILITVDAGRLWRAEQEEIFAPVSSQVLTEKIPANLRHPNNLWFGFTKRARVIMYNKNTVDPAQLSTYENLADPQWKNQLVIRSSSNIYNQSLVAGLIEVHGEQTVEEWCRGIVDNFARPPEGNDRAQIEAAAAGLADLAVANTYYLPRYAKDTDPAKQAIFEQIGVFFPNQDERGTHVNISGGGLVKSAPNREGAIAFLEYLVSPAAQTFFAQGNDEYPIVAGTPVDPIVGSFGTFKEDATNVVAYGANNALAVQIMDRAGWK
ncbi:Iron uptake protein A1 [Hyella patelloides LEGE 07179]|uniref:Iron uptake protein A1 n=1 Tax=Hyella patelloides LEGE 07179 TaxID=945734 RepID=A0A563VSZ3_9CYAN|nr:Fe(3+) ABC transporter substrate-binding protein [Hyella patelloides]VEP14557.1 Iron uptake protein A1 [Hyella patelloides LEGE 07179]